MVDVLVILDGASEPLGAGPTSLQQASTPNLDRLVAAGDLQLRQSTPPGLQPGSEAGIAALLGWVAPQPVDRAAIEAAAAGIPVAPGDEAWRVDVVGTTGRAGPAATRHAAQILQEAAAPGQRVHRLSGHRLLITGPGPLPAAAALDGLAVWPRGIVPPRILGPDTVVIGARGCAIGIARLMGARAIVPAGATGQPDTNLTAKAMCAADAMMACARRVVVHVGGPDEASHQRDAAAKIAVLARADRELIAPLGDVLARLGGTLQVCPDHGCDPATGAHDAAPVPCLHWPGSGAPRQRRLTERDVAGLPVSELAAPGLVTA